MTYKIKLPAQTHEVELRELPSYLWPRDARSKASWILGSARGKAKVLGDMFPRERLISMIEQQQRAEEEFEGWLEGRIQ